MAKVTSDPFNGQYLKSEMPPEVEEPRVPVTKVVTGKVRQEKRSLSSRFKDIFVADSTDIKTYVAQEVIIPGIKNAFMYFLDGIQGAVEMKLFGSVTRRRSSPYNYNALSTNYGKVTFGSPTTQQTTRVAERGRSSMDLGQIVLESKGEADLVLDRLLDQIEQFGSVTVADLYDLVGITENFTDRYFGWKNLSTADVRRVRGGGYALVLPSPVSLK